MDRISFSSNAISMRLNPRLKREIRYARFWSIGALAVAAALSGVVALTPVPMSHSTSAVFLSVAALGGIVFARRKCRPHQFAEDAFVPVLDTLGKKYVLSCPPSRGEAINANELAAAAYDVEPIPVERIEQWLARNDHVLCCLNDPVGKVVGYFDVLPLTDPFAESLLAGYATEQDITYEAILPMPAAHDANYVYVTGIAVAEPDSYRGRRHASMLLWGLIRYFRAYYAKESLMLLASAASPEGRALLERFGFLIASHAAERRDRCDLYRRPLDQVELTEIEHALPSFENLCLPKWQEAVAERTMGTTR